MIYTIHMYILYCMHGSFATRLLDDYNSHFSGLKIWFFHSEKTGVEGINNIFMSNNRDACQSALSPAGVRDAHSSSIAIFQILLKTPLTLSLRWSKVSFSPSSSQRSSFSVVSAGMVIPGNNLLISLNGPLLENPRPSSVSLRSFPSARMRERGVLPVEL
jgi:hypothetical protein